MLKKGKVLNKMSRNEFLIALKCYNSATNKQNIGGSNPNLDFIHINALTKLVKFYPFVLKILCRKEILMSIKGHNSVTDL